MLKLAKLPDRTPAKITITVSADLNQALCDYQKLYAATYGAPEKIADLIPFVKARKEGLPEVDVEKPLRRGRISQGGDVAPASTRAATGSPDQEG